MSLWILAEQTKALVAEEMVAEEMVAEVAVGVPTLIFCTKLVEVASHS